MKFNSQICTTREQSERLIALGLKKETADMVWTHAYYATWVVSESEHPLYEECEAIPAWSLHRLIEMMPQELGGIFFSLSFHDAGYSKPGDWVLYERKGAYDSIINCIEWLIEEGNFCKEYLNRHNKN